MSIGKTENFSSAGKDDPDRSNILLTTLPDCVDSCDENSLEASAFGSLKRKHASEIDSVEDRRKKCTPDLSYCVSPWEFRRLKADLMESQAQRIKLEDRIDQLHKKNKEAVIFFDKEKNEMKSQLESNRNTIKDLEFRLNKVRKRETECKGELIEKTKELEFLKLSHDEKVLKLETENRNMKTRISQLEVDHDEDIIALNNSVKELKHNIGKLELQLLEKEELCLSLNSKLTTAMESSKKLEEVQSELFIAQLRIKELQNEADEFREAKNITLALSEKALRVPDLEKELNDKKLQVANLKQFLHNNIILEEMVQNLKTKLATFEAKQNELPGLKAKLVELESELENWKLLALDFSNDCTRHSLGAYIESLQKKELTATLEVNSLNGEIKSCEKKLSCVQTELEAAKVHNEKLQGVLHKLKVEVQLLRKKSVLISRERDSYRQQLDLYEKDLTLTGFPAENPTGDASFQTKSRIHNLELSLSEYRKHIETLENQLKEYQMEEPETIEKNCKLMEQVKKLEEANMMLTKMKDKLEEKLESRASKGEYLSPNTKIVHFRNNPVYEAEKQQEIELNELKEERDKLRARVKLLESGEVLNITQKVSDDLKNCTSQRIAELEKELQSANLKMQRLKEFFKKTSQEFRDVSYMLLGYRIDLASNSKLYKLYNMYSTSPSDFLMFQQTEKGTMEMLGTSFAESLSKLVDEYLHVGNSIPAFLSAVTLQLYGSTAQSDEDDEDEEDDDNVVNPDDRNDDSNDDDNGGDDDDDDDDDDEDDDDEGDSDNNMVIDVESCIKKVRKKSSSIEPIELD